MNLHPDIFKLMIVINFHSGMKLSVEENIFLQSVNDFYFHDLVQD